MKIEFEVESWNIATIPSFTSTITAILVDDTGNEICRGFGASINQAAEDLFRQYREGYK